MPIAVYNKKRNQAYRWKIPILIDDLPIDRLKTWGIRLPYSSSDRRASLWLLWSQPASLRHVKVGLLKFGLVSLRPRFWGSTKHSNSALCSAIKHLVAYIIQISTTAPLAVFFSRYKYV